MRPPLPPMEAEGFPDGTVLTWEAPEDVVAKLTFVVLDGHLALVGMQTRQEVPA